MCVMGYRLCKLWVAFGFVWRCTKPLPCLVHHLSTIQAVPWTIHKALTPQSSGEPFDLAEQRAQHHVFEGEAHEAGEGADGGDEEVGHGQVHQDVVEVRPQLLVLDGAGDGERVDAGAGHKQDEHEGWHGVEDARAPQVVLGNQEGA